MPFSLPQVHANASARSLPAPSLQHPDGLLAVTVWRGPCCLSPLPPSFPSVQQHVGGREEDQQAGGLQGGTVAGSAPGARQGRGLPQPQQDGGPGPGKALAATAAAAAATGGKPPAGPGLSAAAAAPMAGQRPPARGSPRKASSRKVRMCLHARVCLCVCVIRCVLVCVRARAHARVCDSCRCCCHSRTGLASLPAAFGHSASAAKQVARCGPFALACTLPLPPPTHTHTHTALQAAAAAAMLLGPGGAGGGGTLDAQAVTLNRGRLTGLLEAFGEYPAKYRLLVWWVAAVLRDVCCTAVLQPWARGRQAAAASACAPGWRCCHRGLARTAQRTLHPGSLHPGLHPFPSPNPCPATSPPQPPPHRQGLPAAPAAQQGGLCNARRPGPAPRVRAPGRAAAHGGAGRVGGARAGTAPGGDPLAACLLVPRLW